ncbi:MAG TPA: hypothetical protein VMG99_08905 [Thermoplasmata archaeon]|nr:hypothetical protein [Thermoplasmata archaeon]
MAVPTGWNRLRLSIATPVYWRYGPRGNILVGLETAVPTGGRTYASVPSELKLTPEERALRAGLPIPPVPLVVTAEEAPSLAEQRRRPFPPPIRPVPEERRAPRPRGETHRGIVVVIPGEAVGTLRVHYAAAAKGRSALAPALRIAAYAIHNARLRVPQFGQVTGTSYVPRGTSQLPSTLEEAQPRLAPVTYPTVVALLTATFEPPLLEQIHAAQLISPRFNNYLEKLGWTVCGRIRGSEIVIRCPPLRPPEPRQLELATEFLERGEEVFMRPAVGTTAPPPAPPPRRPGTTRPFF